MRWLYRHPTTRAVNAAPVPGDCGERAGNWRVHWRWLEKNIREENAFLPLVMHTDSPTLELFRDYVGPLCPHERNYLDGNDPTYVVSAPWEFTVTEA